MRLSCEAPYYIGPGIDSIQPGNPGFMTGKNSNSSGNFPSEKKISQISTQIMSSPNRN
jgi:hypothetical protein